MKTLLQKSLLSAVVFALLGGVALVPLVGGGSAGAQPIVSAATAFEGVRVNWVRRAENGPLGQAFEVRVLREYAPAAPVLAPKPGDLYVYVNTGGSDTCTLNRIDVLNSNAHSRVNVIDARSRALLASAELHDAIGPLQSTALSPDGRFAYVPAESEGAAVLFKVDALSLQPLKMLDIGGAVHQMQVWQDRYLLIDTIAAPGAADGEGHAVLLFDPETDTIIGGIGARGTGGMPYASWADPAHEFIYVLMEIASDATSAAFRSAGVAGAMPYWVAKVDPADWSVVAEFPYPGLRSDWIQFDASGHHMYVNGADDDSLSKLDLVNGTLDWRAFTGVGPDGIELDATGDLVWIANKGENWKYHASRTITVVNTGTGARVDTVVADGSGIDHIVLSPDGTEIWASASDSGAVVVLDATTRKNLARIPMPGFGDPHGVVFVAYGDDGAGRVVADQGDFHGGVDPRNGKPLVK
ncbi:MAG: hypothetical protein K0B00_03915 [Rhodobacteraceae bacterium]|nr:hypothetical protein [Paracoccaceae bacterium]